VTSELSSTPAKRGRPRSGDVERAILAAASALLFERGLDAMTIEDVAARACVGKASIYRRWSTKGSLALDAFLVDYVAKQPVVDTGVLEDDLREGLTYWATAVVDTSMGRALVGIIAEAQSDRTLAQDWIDRVMAPARERYRVMVEHAIDRGDIPPGSDVDVIMDLLYGAAYHRLIQGHLAIDADFIAQVARMVARGAQAGAAIKPSSSLS